MKNQALTSFLGLIDVARKVIYFPLQAMCDLGLLQPSGRVFCVMVRITCDIDAPFRAVKLWVLR